MILAMNCELLIYSEQELLTPDHCAWNELVTVISWWMINTAVNTAGTSGLKLVEVTQPNTLISMNTGH